jgi:hypothetical protein
MRLRRVGRERFEFADGRHSTLSIFIGRVTFAGRKQDVLVT